jgi:hypothetical protein
MSVLGSEPSDQLGVSGLHGLRQSGQMMPLGPRLLAAPLAHFLLRQHIGACCC